MTFLLGAQMESAGSLVKLLYRYLIPPSKVMGSERFHQLPKEIRDAADNDDRKEARDRVSELCCSGYKLI